jgi:hypothetical protein
MIYDKYRQKNTGLQCFKSASGNKQNILATALFHQHSPVAMYAGVDKVTIEYSPQPSSSLPS